MQRGHTILDGKNNKIELKSKKFCLSEFLLVLFISSLQSPAGGHLRNFLLNLHAHMGMGEKIFENLES